MKLDRQQKQDFINYWGRCPLVNDKGEFCSVEHSEMSGEKVTYIGYKWYLDGFIDDGENPPEARIRTTKITGSDLEVFDPVFVESGFYQLTPGTAYWVTRKSERSMVKGMHNSNTDLLIIKAIDDKTKTIGTVRIDFDIRMIYKIKNGLLSRFHKPNETIMEAIDRHRERGLFKNVSCALSRNVALVGTSYDIPIVFYKMAPVGFFMDDIIHINKNKAISVETIKEETTFPVEIYEGK